MRGNYSKVAAMKTFKIAFLPLLFVFFSYSVVYSSSDVALPPESETSYLTNHRKWDDLTYKIEKALSEHSTFSYHAGSFLSNGAGILGTCMGCTMGIVIARNEEVRNYFNAIFLLMNFVGEIHDRLIPRESLYTLLNGEAVFSPELTALFSGFISSFLAYALTKNIGDFLKKKDQVYLKALNSIISTWQVDKERFPAEINMLLSSIQQEDLILSFDEEKASNFVEGIRLLCQSYTTSSNS